MLITRGREAPVADPFLSVGWSRVLVLPGMKLHEMAGVLHIEYFSRYCSTTTRACLDLRQERKRQNTSQEVLGGFHLNKSRACGVIAQTG